MNKYLKTYIRNRDIAMVNKGYNKDYELKYLDISKLDSEGIFRLLRWSTEPQKVIDILGDKGKEFISNLDSDDIGWLLMMSIEHKKIKELLKKLRPDLNI